MRLLLYLNAKTDSSGVRYVFVQYVKCVSALDEVNKELLCASVRRSTTDEVVHSTARARMS